MQQQTAPIQFTKATKTKRKARIALVGYEGSGKTMTALILATALAAHDSKRVALADSEGDSALIYADRFDFDHLRLTDHSPQSYIATLKAAAAANYGVLIYDSLSHEWMGSGGALEMKDRLAEKETDSYRAWGKITPEHNKVLANIVGSPIHVIATMRQKKQYDVSKDDKGKTRITLIGTEAVQREGSEYEMDLILNFERDGNVATVAKSRYVGIEQGARFPKPGAEVVALIIAALDEGAEPTAPTPERVPNEIDGLTQSVIIDAAKRGGAVAREVTQAFLAEKQYANWGDFIQYGAADAQELLTRLEPPALASSNGSTEPRTVVEQAELLKPAGGVKR